MNLDPIVQEIPLYLQKDEENLFIFQFPLIKRSRPLSLNGVVKFKEKSLLFDVGIPFDTNSHHYESFSGIKMAQSGEKMLKFLNVTGSKVDCGEIKYFACFGDSENGFVLRPVQSAIQFRPKLSHCENQSEKNNVHFVDATGGSELSAEEIEPKVVKRQTLQKKRDILEASSHLQKCAEIKRFQDEEPWKDFLYITDENDDLTKEKKSICLENRKNITQPLIFSKENFKKHLFG